MLISKKGTKIVVSHPNGSWIPAKAQLLSTFLVILGKKHKYSLKFIKSSISSWKWLKTANSLMLPVKCQLVGFNGSKKGTKIVVCHPNGSWIIAKAQLLSTFLVILGKKHKYSLII